MRRSFLVLGFCYPQFVLQLSLYWDGGQGIVYLEKC